MSEVEIAEVIIGALAGCLAVACCVIVTLVSATKHLKAQWNEALAECLRLEARSLQRRDLETDLWRCNQERAFLDRQLLAAETKLRDAGVTP